MAQTSVAVKKPVRKSVGERKLESGCRREGQGQGGFPGSTLCASGAPAGGVCGKGQAQICPIPGKRAHRCRLEGDGDAALAAAGLTPTQAVRMLWSLAVRYQGEPEKLRAALDPDSAKASADELAERTA